MCFVRGPSAIFVLNVEFFLLFSSSLVGPKWAHSLIFRVKLLMSVCSVVELKFPGVGQKFKFFPSRLYSGILKECFVRLTTFPRVL